MVFRWNVEVWCVHKSKHMQDAHPIVIIMALCEQYIEHMVFSFHDHIRVFWNYVEKTVFSLFIQQLDGNYSGCFILVYSSLVHPLSYIWMPHHVFFFPSRLFILVDANMYLHLFDLLVRWKIEAPEVFISRLFAVWARDNGGTRASTYTADVYIHARTKFILFHPNFE